RSCRSAPIRPATSVSMSAWESTRMPSRRTSPSCSSRSLPTNADRSILGFAIASTPPCRPSPAKRELTERCAMAALPVYAAGLYRISTTCWDSNDYDGTTIEVEEEDEDDPLTDEQLEFLLDLLKNPDLDESDAELVLTVLKSR